MADIDNDAIEAAFSKGGFPEPTWDFEFRPWYRNDGRMELRGENSLPLVRLPPVELSDATKAAVRAALKEAQS